LWFLLRRDRESGLERERGGEERGGERMRIHSIQNGGNGVSASYWGEKRKNERGKGRERSCDPCFFVWGSSHIRKGRKKEGADGSRE